MTSDRNDIMITCRIPRDDVEYIDELAAAAGCSRSEYIRRVLKLPVAMQAESSATIMITCRIPRDDVEYIDELAAAAGCSRSEYIRRVLKLPVAMQAESSATLRTSRGDRRIGTTARKVEDDLAQDANETPVSDCDATQAPRAVLLLTDVPIRKLCVAIDRWGTNYNQAVRALNAIAKRFSDMPVVNRDDANDILYFLQVCACVAIDRWGTNYNQAVRALNAIAKRFSDMPVVNRDDANDILYFLQVCAQGNEQAKRGIDAVAEEAQQLLGVATVDMRKQRPRRRRAVPNDANSDARNRSERTVKRGDDSTIESDSTCKTDATED